MKNCSIGKIAFVTQGAALSEARRRGWFTSKAYRCKICGLYHLTQLDQHRSENKRFKQRKRALRFGEG